MVLKQSKTLTSKEGQRAFFRCEQVKKIEEKTCTHPCLRGVRWSQRVKGGLGAFPSIFKRFFVGFFIR